MNTYFSTFIAGLGEVVTDALRKMVSDVKIELISDGLVVYKTSVNPQKIKGLRFFNNSFVLLGQVREKDSQLAMKRLVDKILKTGISYNQIKQFLPQDKRLSFRVMFSQENNTISVGQKVLSGLEKKLASDYLFVNRTNPGIEFLFLTRDDGQGLLGLRLTQHHDYKKTLHAGELRPELANLLCILSEPKPNDVFLDPFAGYGAIAIERAISFSYKQIYARDIDEKLVTGLKKRASKFGKRFAVFQLDATNLSQFPNDSVDKVVTDPPWGIYSASTNIDALYASFLKEFGRVLRPGGIVVVLTGRSELLDSSLAKEPKFSLQNKYNILVSGKKAVVHKLMKS